MHANLHRQLNDGRSSTSDKAFYQIGMSIPIMLLSFAMLLLCDRMLHAASARLPTCYENVNCSWTYYVHDTGTHPFATGECIKVFQIRPAGWAMSFCALGSFSCSEQRNCRVPNGVGRLSEIRGGNLTITVVAAKNLPDMDAFGAAGGETDAFIRVTIGNKTKDSAVARNSLSYGRLEDQMFLWAYRLQAQK